MADRFSFPLTYVDISAYQPPPGSYHYMFFCKTVGSFSPGSEFLVFGKVKHFSLKNTAFPNTSVAASFPLGYYRKPFCFSSLSLERLFSPSFRSDQDSPPEQSNAPIEPKPPGLYHSLQFDLVRRGETDGL